jgi:hypothetical protein
MGEAKLGFGFGFGFGFMGILFWAVFWRAKFEKS